MRGVVTDQLQGAWILARDEFDAGVAVDRVGEIGDRAVQRHRDRALGQGGGDGLGDFGAGDSGLIGSRGAVGKSDVDHSRS